MMAFIIGMVIGGAVGYIAAALFHAVDAWNRRTAHG